MSSNTSSGWTSSDKLFRGLVIAAIAFATLCAILVGVLIPTIGLILAFLGLVAILSVYLVIRWRSARQEMALWSLALASAREMPLTPALEGLAGEGQKAESVRLRRLGRMLEHGVPLPEAIRLTPGVIPYQAEPMIRVGWETGKTAEALREATNSIMSRQLQRTAIASRLGYLGFVLVLMQLIVFFLMYFVLPKYQAIFRDFGVPLPKVTQLITWAGQIMSSQFSPIFMLIINCELLFLLFLPLLLIRGWRKGFPLFDRLFVRKHGMAILRLLAWEVDANSPLSRGIDSMARHYPSAWVRGRLELVLDDLEEGTDCWAALVDRKLLRPADKTLLDAASRVGNLSWALRELAEAGERRYEYRLKLWLQCLSTFTLLCLGFLTLLVCLAYFTPLVAIIRSLS